MYDRLCSKRVRSFGKTVQCVVESRIPKNLARILVCFSLSVVAVDNLRTRTGKTLRRVEAANGVAGVGGEGAGGGKDVDEDDAKVKGDFSHGLSGFVEVESQPDATASDSEKSEGYKVIKTLKDKYADAEYVVDFGGNEKKGKGFIHYIRSKGEYVYPATPPPGSGLHRYVACKEQADPSWEVTGVYEEAADRERCQPERDSAAFGSSVSFLQKSRSFLKEPRDFLDEPQGKMTGAEEDAA